MDGLQKLIVTFFILTIILSIMSLLMFFIEVPYKSTVHCVENTTRSANDYELNSMLHTNGKMQDCVWTEPKEPSIVFDAIINLSIICGSIFIVLSAYAYYRKSKQNKTPPTQPQ